MLRARLLLLALLGSVLAAPAGAAVVGFSGTLDIRIGFLPVVSLPGSGAAVVNGSGGLGALTALDVPGAAFQTSGLVLSVTSPTAHPIRGIQLTLANGAGHFAGVANSDSFGGTMPLGGFAKVCLFGVCSAAVANLTVPLSVVGQGGVALVTAAVNLTVQGAPWTTGYVASPSGATRGRILGSPIPNTAQLVTPVFVSTNIPASAVVPVTLYLSLQGLAIPEPGTFALLASGIAGLVAYGRSRGRS